MHSCYCRHHCKPHCPETPQIPIASPTAGGWTSWLQLTRSEAKIFYTAIQGLIGADYIPYAVHSQVVAGTNYLFLTAKEVITGGTMTRNLVTIAEIGRSHV